MIVRYKLTLTMITALASDWKQLEEGGSALASLREASARWASRERARPRCPSGVSRLDEALGGGWPQGRVCELVGPRSCGRTGVAIATLATATARGEVAAWIDGADAFDPASAAAAGVSLDRVLWVRPRALGETVRAAEMVLEAGGFTALVLDLGAGQRAGVRRARGRRPRRRAASGGAAAAAPGARGGAVGRGGAGALRAPVGRRVRRRHRAAGRRVSGVGAGRHRR